MTPTLLLLSGLVTAEVPSITAALGVIWDPDRPAVILAAEPKVRKQGLSHADELGIESLHPVTGKVRWRSKAASVPLVTWRGMILALVETHGQPGLPLVLLDGKTGKLVRTLPLLKEAGGVGQRIGEAMSSSFEISATRTGDTAFISWKSAYWYVGGVPAPRDYRASGGTVAVDLVTGESRGVTSRTPAPEGAGNPYLLAPPGPIPYNIPPFNIDGVRCELAFTGTGNGADVLLRRSKEGQPLPDTRLGAANAGYVHVWPSLDRRHLLRTEQIDDPVTRISYRWSLFESATGATMSAFELRGILPRYIVHRNRLIAFLEGAVAAYDIRTGAAAWSRGGRTIRYHGPYPP